MTNKFNCQHLSVYIIYFNHKFQINVQIHNFNMKYIPFKIKLSPVLVQRECEKIRNSICDINYSF